MSKPDPQAPARYRGREQFPWRQSVVVATIVVAWLLIQQHNQPPPRPRLSEPQAPRPRAVAQTIDIGLGEILQADNKLTPTQIGGFHGLGVWSDEQLFGIFFEIPAGTFYPDRRRTQKWDVLTGSVNMVLTWTNGGRPLNDTETVIWECEWRERHTRVVYTQGDLGIDGEIFEATFPLSLVIGDDLNVNCFRDGEADTYAGDAVLLRVHFVYWPRSFDHRLGER